MDEGLQVEFGALRLFRIWRYWPEAGLKLFALMTDHEWKPGNNIAHSTPKLVGSGRHGHGFFGWYYIRELELQEPEVYQNVVEHTPHLHYYQDNPETEKKPWHVIVGTALYYGRVMDAERGARSTQATPESLILYGHPYLDKRIKELADVYNMTTMTLDKAKRIECGIIPSTTKDLGLE